MAIGQPVPDPGTGSNRINFKLKSPTGSGASVDLVIDVRFPGTDVDPNLTEVQKNALIQKLVDFFNGNAQVIAPVTATKSYLVTQTITPNGA
jgi:hypothetical protein